MSALDLDPAAAIWVGIAMFLLWLFGVAIRDASIVDVFWGIGFVLIAAIANDPGGYEPRQAIVGLLVSLWGIRLAVHLSLRNRGKGEDPRYRAMRERWGARFPAASLVQVYLLQGALMLVVSLPIQAAMRASSSSLTPLDVLGAAIAAGGIAFEAVGDLQLTRFRAKRSNTKKVMDQGLWRYTRHPNYFGDCLMWWGFGIIALGVGAWWALFGPVVMTVLLVRVSGVTPSERRMGKSRPGYAEYARRTSAFVPLPPKKTTPEPKKEHV